MDERDSASAPTAVERPGASSPATLREPSSPVRDRPSTVDSESGSAFDPPPDRFETKSELGRGGMGRVDEAYDRALGRPVAIKHMLAPGGTEQARFEREVRITARLEHPGIVPIHDTGRSPDGTPYYVMRRVDGQPLSDMTSGKSLDERLALVPNLLAACDAAGFAHARNVVHRDIKPTNILIGPFGETLLIDWGLARELDERDGGGSAVIPSQPELTRAGTVAGTPGFMSPEQARGESVDARADVFALGVTLFYVLTGKLPWGSASATEMVNVVGAGRAPSWDLLPEEVPGDLRAVLEKAMATEPEQRYADGRALAADLRRYITGNLVGARHYGWFERFLRFVQKHRAVMAVGAISLAIVAVIAVISVRRVIVERDDARAARALAEQRAHELADSADELLVDSAQQLAEKNPIAAIAKLRRLRPDSKRWREAWAAASTAWFNGIPFGFVNESGSASLETATDSRHLLITNMRTGGVVVVDLVGRSRREVAKVGRVFRCGWVDVPRAIMCQREDDIVIIDVATGAQRTVELRIDGIYSNRGSRILMRSRSKKQVLELRAGQDAPVVLMEGVDDLVASRDLTWFIVRRGIDSTLHHGDRTWSLPWKTSIPPVLEVDSGVVTVMLDEEIQVLRIVDDKLELFARTPRTRPAMGVVSAAGESFIVSVDGASRLNDRGLHLQKRLAVRGYFATARGFVLHGTEGELSVLDEVGWFDLGRRPHSYRFVDQSPDGRFVSAITESGDLLVWDLRGPRGRTIALEKSEEPRHIDENRLWLIDAGGGIYTRDLPSGARTIVTTTISPLARYIFDPLARFVAVTEHDAKQTSVYDVKTGRMFKLEADPMNLAIDEGGLAYVLADRTLWRWTPGRTDTPSTKLGQFPLLPSFLAVTDDYAVGVAGSREVMRLHIPTGNVERIVVEGPDVFRIAVEVDGRAWLLAEGQAWRWDRGGTKAIPVTATEPFTDLTPLPRGVLFANSKSLTLQNGDERRVLSSMAGRYIVMAEDLIASLDSTFDLGVIDLTTARRISLPMRSVSTYSLVSHGTRLGVITGSTQASWNFTYWDLEVPRDPAALQRWLATITNAKPIPDSDAVAWPGN